ncbi:uncharacterized protein SETTUDRAFT_160021 [Exserohilum turcica Et28A]|uniref:Uncharacterized protein n=1 Tax=Exserohilum turcicum (strain 28A) TaxID=671987 RepID=R0IVM4_EXST2|nr:uncharacterized protein SETTUDRAFT_160021 [Exserohilum turcica Et28A]EOA88845.1 hypothetical protein SETTUDRAFT_160021 [Exserohilum turcica Et28A]
MQFSPKASSVLASSSFPGDDSFSHTRMRITSLLSMHNLFRQDTCLYRVPLLYHPLGLVPLCKHKGDFRPHRHYDSSRHPDRRPNRSEA